MLGDIIETIIECIFLSLPLKIALWLASIALIVFGVLLYQAGEIDLSYWIMSGGVFLAIIALLISAFSKKDRHNKNGY